MRQQYTLIYTPVLAPVPYGSLPHGSLYTVTYDPLHTPYSKQGLPTNLTAKERQEWNAVLVLPLTRVVQ